MYDCDYCDVPFFLLFVLVVIGFNQTTYSVREDAGSVAVSVSVMNGTILQDVIITLSTALGGSATGGIIALRSTAPSLPNHELYVLQTPCISFLQLGMTTHL